MVGIFQFRCRDEEVTFRILVGGSNESKPSSIDDQGADDPSFSAWSTPTTSFEMRCNALFFELIEQLGKSGDFTLAGS